MSTSTYQGGTCYHCGRPSVQYGSISARVLDLLIDDGGWWTLHDIKERLGVDKYATAQRVILRHRHLIESRPDPDNYRALQYRWRGE